MRKPKTIWIGGGILVLVLAGITGAYLLLGRHAAPPPAPALPAPVAPAWPVSEVIGTSTEGRAITAYTYGSGPQHLLLVGGMHGGYEWNAVLLAYQFMDYFKANPDAVPSALSVTIIPSLNPDGVYKVTGSDSVFTAADVSPDPAVDAAGRFNADGVDLNRNFDCNWQATSTWQNRIESAGTAPFSEPESQALRNFVLTDHPIAVVFWHSQSGSVYASECNNGILPGTLDAMNTYAKASGYSAIKSFDAYPITGDSEGWLASINIPAITVELKTHATIEWAQNLAGVQALFALYAPAPR